MDNHLVLVAQRIQDVRYMQIVSAALLVTDWVTLFPLEVELVWPAQWALTKFLYLLSRYLPFLDTTLNLFYYLDPHISTKTCKWNYTVSTWSTAAGMGLTELILVVRTYAIYDRSVKIKYFFSVLWIVWVGANIPVIYLFTQSTQYGSAPHPQMPGCYLIGGSEIVFASFASLLCFEILVVVLTVRKAYQHYKRSMLRDSLLLVLYRDGITFFVLIAACSLGNVILLLSAPDDYLDLLNTFTRIMHSLLCCRVLLHLKRAGRRPISQEGLRMNSPMDNHPTLPSSSTFKFATPPYPSTAGPSSEAGEIRLHELGYQGRSGPHPPSSLMVIDIC